MLGSFWVILGLDATAMSKLDNVATFVTVT
jgi:hypothetical protein